MASDTNAGALDVGLDAVLEYVSRDSFNHTRQLMDTLCKSVVEKAFGAKSSTVAK